LCTAYAGCGVGVSVAVEDDHSRVDNAESVLLEVVGQAAVALVQGR
jgi:hypothetical protein